MQQLFDYMLKMSVCLAVTGIFYFLLLRRLTQYTGNRFFLLIGTILSFIIPIVNINRLAKPGALNNVFFINRVPAINYTLPGVVANDNSFERSIQLLFFALFVITASLLLIRFLVRLASLKKITAKAQLISKGYMLLFNVEENIAPFSFGRSIYINKSMYSPAELEDVIRHETVHVQQRHTVDVIFAELVCILNWYNPFAWYVKNAIKQNLEFIADDVFLRSNVSKKNYQYLLLKVTGSVPFDFTNNLNFSCLKNRIAMMNKAKTSRLHLLKLMFVVPLGCILLFAFRKAYNNKVADSSPASQPAASGETFTLGALTYAVNDAAAETLIKNNQDNSLLKPGNVLSFSSIQQEKFRLAGLLKKNGYDTSGSHSIYFMVDTFSTNKSFSIQIMVNVPPRHAVIKPTGNTQAGNAKVMDKGSNKYPGGIMANNMQASAYIITGNQNQYRQQIKLIPDGKEVLI